MKRAKMSQAETPQKDVFEVKSDRKGLAGFTENLFRKFKTFMHMMMMLPLYAMGCLCVGAAAAPGLYVLRFAYHQSHDLNLFLRMWAMGAAAAAAYLIYGFSLILIMPTVNYILRTKLSEWRGPYYSLPAIKWFIHNGTVYIARYTFLEFITPTPFSLMFYQMMGMKIGRGTNINTTHISDPSLISLGEKVTIGGSVTIVGHYGQGGFLVLAPVKIGNKVTIGLRATIMGNVEIGDEAKVLPNSVVMPKTRIPAGEIWGGVPARKIEKAELEAKPHIKLKRIA